LVCRLGFVLQGIHRFEPGLPAYAFLTRGTTSIHLSEHRGDAPQRGVVYWYVGREMLTTFAAEFGVGIERQPWCDEIQLTDPDGNRLRIGCPNEEHDPGFEAAGSLTGREPDEEPHPSRAPARSSIHGDDR
jgi:hypothetical protein